MAGQPKFNLLVPIEYGEGQAKGTRWVRFGSVWENEQGNLSGKVDFWPVGASDRVVLMPPKSGEQYDNETGEIR